MVLYNTCIQTEYKPAWRRHSDHFTASTGIQQNWGASGIGVEPILRHHPSQRGLGTHSLLQIARNGRRDQSVPDHPPASCQVYDSGQRFFVED